MTDRSTAHHPIALRWVDDVEPSALPTGATCGFALPRGTVKTANALALLDGAGQPADAQFWPLAAWPDGSLKWAGVCVTRPAKEYVVVARDRDVADAIFDSGSDGSDPVVQRVRVIETEDSVVVDTGVVHYTIDRAGTALVGQISRGNTVVARNLELVSSVQHEAPESDGPTTRISYVGRVQRVTVEQDGPQRAVVRLEGTHEEKSPADGSSPHDWLPFTVRLYFAAGAEAARIVHTMIWNGDSEHDFLTSLGVRASVPLRDELHDRHVRIAGADGGFFSEAVRGITGLRRDPGQTVREAQIAGRGTPPINEWNADVTRRLHLIPTWSDFTLTQLSADGYALRKRTKPGYAWVGATAGTRADGFAYLGDTRGGIALGVQDFWQSNPAQFDIRDAASDGGSVTAWLYSPEAQPMDMRFYHDGLGQDDFETQLEGLEITYEDYEPGFGDANGIARTHSLTLFTYAATPAIERLAADAAAVARPPQLAASPASLHAAGVFGDWSLPDRSTPARAELEDQLDGLFEFYRGQVDQRRWYGFWHYGDVMHTYDADRHVWRYDVGGFAWDNSELSPDLWLWYAFVRSGRADVFRMAEAMTRHTGEVDVYHLGRWKGLGSRHNVLHWGCSAKQLRISSPAYRRFYYYLTADERTGDLMTELRDSDQNFLGLDPTRKVREDAATYRPERSALAVGLGTDWGALAATWLTDWERTGNEHSRDRLLGTMEDIGALRYGFLTGEALYDLDTGRFDQSRERISISHLNSIFGLVEMCSELISLVDVPGFTDAWLRYCRLYLASPEEQIAEIGEVLTGTNLTQAHSRLTAFAAARLDDAELARAAWRAFDAAGEFLAKGDFHHPDAALRIRRVEPPIVSAPVDEARRVSTNASAQFALAAIQNLSLIGDAIDERTR